MTDPPRPPPVDLVLLALAVVAVSTSAPLIRGAEAPTLAIAFWRTILALPVTGGVLLLRGAGRAGRPRQPGLGDLDALARRRSVAAGLFLAAHFATWVPSLSFTSVASSVALVSSTPIWSALLARHRGQPVTARTWRGIAVALGGVVLLTGVDLTVTPRALFGDALALAGGILAAFYLEAGAEVRRETSTAVYTTVCYSVAAAALLAVCLVARQPLGGYDGETWLLLGAITLGPQLLGHTVVNRVLRTTSPTLVSVAILGEIVFAALLAWAFFDEVPPAAAIPAAVLLAVGVVTVVRAGGSAAAATAGRRDQDDHEDHADDHQDRGDDAADAAGLN
ncbi:MAG: DMT family transporter [Acidimicrobiales bacterium]